MIKLIATDLDGTLLNEHKELPEEIFEIIDELHSLGVLFVPASGRQYANMKKLFAPAWQKLVFLCENGALVKRGEKTLYCNPVPAGGVKKALREIRAIPNVYPMLCAADCAYIEDDKEPFFTLAKLSYDHCERVETLDAIDEEICKIAIYDEIGSAENCIKKLPQKIPELRTILSGFDWCDVSAPTANKGDGLRFLQGALGIKKEECVGFGDHMNDYEMLLECGRAYVPENAFPYLKERFEHVPANSEGGVIKKLGELIKEIKGE